MKYFFIILMFIFPGIVFAQQEAIVRSGFIFDLQVNHVHSSCPVELPNGDIVTVWFEITDNGRERTSKNVQLRGSRLRSGAKTWSAPFLMAETPFFPDGNPVLFLNQENKLFLVWHVLQAEVWHAAVLKVRTSTDYLGEGAPVWEWQDNLFLKPGEDYLEEVAKYDDEPRTNSQDPVLRGIGWMTRLQPLILRQGPHQGRLLLPLYNESQMLSLCAISEDDGTTWTPGLPIVGNGNIQPALVPCRNGDIVAFMRDNGGLDYSIQTSRSTDGGYSWSAVQPMNIDNPNASVDVKALRDGRWAMVCNDMKHFRKLQTGACDGRQRLALYLSEDEGSTWTRSLIFEDDTNKPDEAEKRGRYHYPSLIQTRDGLLHLTYTYNKRETPYADGLDNAIKHVVIDPARL